MQGADTPHDMLAWKAALRKAALERRQAISAPDRLVWDRAITAHLLAAFPQLASQVVGMYWPYQGEWDPRPAMLELCAQGATAALPEVVRKGEALQFRAWWPDAPLRAGVYGIPVPEGTPQVSPQALLIPPVAFDAEGYRLGYGGGFYDRTLASSEPRPLAIGVAYEVSRVATIGPQAHDLPMDYLVTERGVFRPQTPSAT